MKIKKRILILLFVSFFSAHTMLNDVAFANNPTLINYSPEVTQKPEYTGGSTYWPTSSIREWLNSNQSVVHYTNENPSYVNEPGFLKDFTPEEYDAIAVTERRSVVHSVFGTIARDGGTMDYPTYNGYSNTHFIHIAISDFDKNSMKYYYQKVKEKVFILDMNELNEYVIKRGSSLVKQLTAPEMQKLNKSDPSYFYVTSSYRRSYPTYHHMWSVDANGKAFVGSVVAKNGIVPAIHIKPDYVFDNGKKANSLIIGEKVVFGQHNGLPIEWEVVNRTPEGFPLLWSDKILSVKTYDSPGSVIYRNSESVVFDDSDISIVDSLKYTTKSNYADVTAPTIRVANEADMLSRRNDKFTLIVEARDEEGGSGIDYIILPNGTKDYRNMVNYEIVENGRYDFTAVDKAGNHFGFEVPIGNISPSPIVTIKSSSNGWTNKDVTVDISTTTQQVTEWFLPSSLVNVSGPYWSNYSTYSEKRIKVSGKVKIVDWSGKFPNNARIYAGLTYRLILKYGNNYRVSDSSSYVLSTYVSNLSTEEFTEYESITTVPSNYFDQLRPIITTSTNGEDTGKLKVEWKDVKVELLDKEDFYIEKIILPNNSEVYEPNYSEVLTEPGEYTYQVLDSRGKITERTITVKIDKEKPSATHSFSPSAFTNQDVAISVTGIDLLSGIKRIKKPNGEWVTAHNTIYYVSQNGTYDFTIEDNAGNTFLYTVTVSHIDKEKPTIVFTPLARDWDISDIAVSIDIQDKGVSGIKQYRYAWSENQTKPASGWSGWYADTKGLITTNKNGMLYLHIEAVDFAGNEIYSSSGLYKKLRENENPMINLSIFPQPGKWSNQFLEVSISENLDYSSDLYVEKRYEITNIPAFPTNVTQVLPLNRKVLLDKEGASYLHIQYTLSNGTRIKHSAGPYLIDRGKPDNYTTTIRTSSGAEITDWTNQRIYLAISNPVTSSVSGYTKQYRIENLDRDWQTYQENTEIIMEGAHRIFTRIVNEAGAAGSQQTVTSKLDKTPPTLNALNVVKETDGTYTVIVDANDSHSNIANIEVTMEDNTKKTTVSTNNLFRFSQLNKLPKHIVITDRASNRTPEITFASMPSITFAAPYNRVIPSYRGEVATTISNGVNLNYQIGNKKLDCESNTCSFSVDRNTTIVATNTEGNKTASHTVAITNLDKSKLNLVMEGKRANNQIAFSWNYAITNGTLTCYKNGIKQENIHISGKDTSINATNAIYDCSLNGTYSAEVVQSNRVVIYPDTEQPVDAPEGGNGSIKNLYIEESRAGISYFVNTKSTNAQDSYVPLPPNAFGN